MTKTLLRVVGFALLLAAFYAAGALTQGADDDRIPPSHINLP